MARTLAWCLAVVGLPTLLIAGEKKPNVPKLAAQCREGKAAACAELTRTARSHPSLYVREEAIPHVTDPVVLAEIARQDTWYGARKRAVEKIDDPAVLASIVKTDKETSVQEAAIKRLTDQNALAGLAADAKTPDAMRMAALEKLTDAEALKRVGLELDDRYGFADRAAPIIAERLAEDKAMAELIKAPSRHMRDATRDKVKNPVVIGEILKSEKASDETRILTRRLEDPAVLADVALKAQSAETRFEALLRVHDLAVLTKALADTDVKVKQFATLRLAAIKGNVVLTGQLKEVSLGRPVADFRIDLYDNQIGSLAQARTDAEGRFSVAGVEPGHVYLQKVGGGQLLGPKGRVSADVPYTGKVDLGTIEIEDDDVITAALAPVCDGKPAPPPAADVLFFSRSPDDNKGGSSRWRHSYISRREFEKIALGWKAALCVTSSSRSVGSYVDKTGRSVGTAYASAWDVHVVRLDNGKTWDKSFHASPPQSTISYSGIAANDYGSPSGQVVEWLKTLASSAPAP